MDRFKELRTILFSAKMFPANQASHGFRMNYGFTPELVDIDLNDNHVFEFISLEDAENLLSDVIGEEFKLRIKKEFSAMLERKNYDKDKPFKIKFHLSGEEPYPPS